jgi:hypothetical protein
MPSRYRRLRERLMKGNEKLGGDNDERTDPTASADDAATRESQEKEVVGGSRRTTPRPALSHPSKAASRSGRLLSAEEQAGKDYRQNIASSSKRK